MSPVVLAALRDGLVSALALVIAALVPLVVAASLRLLRAHTTATQYQAATALIGSIVTAIEQEMGTGSSGAAKKDAALRAASQMVPWLPPAAASTLIEAGVGAMNGLTAIPPAVHVLDTTPQAPPERHQNATLTPPVPPPPA